MNFKEYLELKAINATFLKACHKSPYDGWHCLHTPAEPTPAMDFGSAVHTALLEPETFDDRYIVIPADAPKRLTKAQIEAFEKFPTLEKPTKAQAVAYQKSTMVMNYWNDFDLLNKDRTVLDSKEMDKVKTAVLSCWKIMHVREALQNFEKEKTFTWSDGWNKFKSRLDLVSVHDGVIIDVKTTNDASERAFTNKMIDQRWDIQMYHYARSLGKTAPNLYMIGIESTTGEVACYNVTDFVYSDFTKSRYELALDTARKVLQMQECPAKFKPVVVELKLPKWAETSESA